MMDIEINDKYSFNIEVGQGVLGGYGYVVEQTEAHSLPACSMVPGRSDQGESAIDLSVHHRINCCQSTTSSVHSRIV
jgi:hypothetical protein